MQRLCFCFKCGKCTCIVCEGKEDPKRDLKEKKISPTTSLNKNLVETINTCTDTYAKMANMDIYSNTPFVASSSSIKSTPIVESQPTLEDIQIAYQKLQSLISDPLVKYAIPTRASEKYLKTFPKASENISSSGGFERQRSSGPYFTSNKIAYKGPLSTGSNTPTLSNSQDGPYLATLQDLIQKMSIKKTPPMTQECSLVDESTKRLMNKLKNLDEILQNLDNSLLCRKNSTKLFTPQVNEDHLVSNIKSSNKSYSTSNDIFANNVRLLSTDEGLTFATPPCPATPMCNLGLDEKPSTNLRERINLNAEKSWSESRSSDTQVPQSFATPITKKTTKDVPLLLSKFASFGYESSETLHNEEKAMKEVVEMIVVQVEQQILQRMRCLRRGPQRRVNTILS